MQRRILVVDDSPLILKALRYALEAEGMTVDTAESLDQLETHRTSTPPDAIVLDLQMPEAWGDDVATTLREAYGVSVPLLLMSSIEPAELAERAKEASVAWVSKREGLPGIVERVRSILGDDAANVAETDK